MRASAQSLAPSIFYTLPTQNELNGNLVVPVRNPLTGVLYPGTNIPVSPAPSIRSPLRSLPLLSRRFNSSCPSPASPATGAKLGDYSN